MQLAGSVEPEKPLEAAPETPGASRGDRIAQRLIPRKLAPQTFDLLVEPVRSTAEPIDLAVRLYPVGLPFPHLTVAVEEPLLQAGECRAVFPDELACLVQLCA